MPRPPRCRRICQAPQYETFSPEECPRESEAVTLTLDEYEVIRLVDLEKKTHEQCAAQMDISRTTVTEIYETAREKIALNKNFSASNWHFSKYSGPLQSF